MQAFCNWRSNLTAVVLAGLCIGTVRAESASPWGVSPSAELCRAPASWADEMAQSGVTWVRGFEDAPDGAGLEPLVRAGLSVSGTLWWSPGKVLTFPVDDLPGFRRYVLERVTRFKGVVHNWEVWNEPPNFTADPSPVSYGRIVAEAYDAAKSVDPNVQIGLAAKSVHIAFLAEAIEGGARGKYDYITLHPYETAELLPQGWEGPFMGIVSTVRAMLEDKDPAKAQVPIWFTEISLEAAEHGRKGVSIDVQADTLVKIFVMSLAQGVSHVHWFDPRDSEEKAHGLLRSDGSKRPAMLAFENLVQYLGRVPDYQGVVNLVPDSFAFLFETEKGSALVAWSKPGVRSGVRFGGPVTVLEPGTGRARVGDRVTLTPSPVIILAEQNLTVARSWVARASKTLPAWDGGKPTKSVSLVAGRKPQGIHMVNPPPTKRGSRATEFDLSGTIGARFAVDPAYFTYDGGPIEISAVVRGHGHGHPGFMLKYESKAPIAASDGHGMIGAGTWNNLTGDTPTTFTWVIHDARFIGKYGANFALSCDGPEFSDFSLLSVKIKKL